MTHARSRERGRSRREFLRYAGAAAVAAQLPALDARLLARARGGGSGRSLVVLYLRGGADWLNMLIPWKDPLYREARSGIALGEDDGIVPLDDRFALHPAMAPLAPLYEEKQLAPVLCVGSPHPTRSHFDAQDFMEYGAPGLRSVRSGWLNRYLELTRSSGQTEFRALAMQERLPRSLRGPFPALAVPSNMDKKRGQRTLSRFEEFYGGGEMERRTEDDDVVSSGRVTIATLQRFHGIVAEGEAAREGAGYPEGRFGQRLAGIAQVLRADAGLEVAGLDYNGWDHHINQGGNDGQQATMLANLCGSLAAFCRDLGPRLERTTVLVMTEFGRTVKENGNSGTDHGRGAGMLVLGGGVEGGKVHGDWRGLEKKALVDGRDLPVTTDFRDVMAATLRGALEFDPPEDFFPGYQPRKLRLF